MNYIIDVYRGNIRAERNIINFALFVSFFPQIIAGPIERATNLLPQFDVEKKFDSRRIADGMKLMLWGFFQKVVIADNLAVFVDAVYKNPREYGGFILIMATIFFTFQIFCDFSGYSDIAIGAAQVFGFNSIQNFNRPYFSQSIPEFWRRWHISLTSWFRDYLYIPLGGNRVSKPRWYLNIFIVFLISGLWHGSTWTFALWGAIHGIYYLFSLFTKDLREKIVHVLWLQKFPAIHTLIKTVITFILVSFAWIFFRGNNIHDTLYIVTSLFSKWKIDNCSIKLLSTYYFEIFVGTSSIIFLLVIQYLQKDIKFKEWIMKKPIYFRWIIYYTGIVTILLFGNLGVKQFIYFKF